MRCPGCCARDTRVIDSRPSHDGDQIRRRRHCAECGGRFTTYERLDEVPLVVVKKDGRRQEFNPQKLLDGLIKASEKRPVPLAELRRLVDDVTVGLRDERILEVPVGKIGEMVLARLQDLDTIAYVRFASVYRNFEEPEDFLREVQHVFEEGTMMGHSPRKGIVIRIKRVRKTDLPLPDYAHTGDAGLDLLNAGETMVIEPGGRILVPTGLAVAVPPGYELQIRPRSGLALRHGVTVLNAPGTIDSGYRGELGIILVNTDRHDSFTLEHGERIAQAVLSRCERIVWSETEDIDQTSRGEGGFGSTGRKTS